MLHLVPIRWLVTAVIVAVATMVFATVYAGWVTEASAVAGAFLVVRGASLIAAALITAMYAAWRWLSPVQEAIFPYLGGKWTGVLKFEGAHGPGERDINLEIKHTLFTLQLLLDTKESSSRTLAVHAERDAHFERYRLFYVYLTERKDGFAGAGDAYRGLAVLRVERAARLQLLGSYFTEQNGRGTLSLTRKTATPWWMLWR